MWVDFMVRNDRITLHLGDDQHRFDEDLLFFTSYLVNRKYQLNDVPDDLRTAMLDYHQRLNQIVDSESAMAFFTFIRNTTMLVSSATSIESPSEDN